MPRKRNKNGVYLTEVGTDTAKEQIYNRFTLISEGDEPLAGAVHFPNNPEIYDLTEAQQLTAEEQVEKWVDGKKKIVWDSKNDEMRLSTALFTHWRRFVSAYPAGSLTLIHFLPACWRKKAPVTITRPWRITRGHCLERNNGNTD